MANDCPSNCGSPDLGICDEVVVGPTVVVAQPTGTPAAPCPVDTVCSVNNCCNFFDLVDDGQGDSFLFSAGGPFLVGFCDCGTSLGHCPSPCGLGVLSVPSVMGFINPGPLTDDSGGGAEPGIVCFGMGGCSGSAGGVAPGTFEFTARVELVNALPGMRVVVLFFPDCQDPSTSFKVLDCGVPCSCCATEEGPQSNVICCCVNTQPVCTVCSGELSAFSTSCNPGFQLLVQPPCLPNCAVNAGAAFAPVIQNFQFGGTRLTNQDVINCGSPLVPTSQYLSSECTTLVGCSSGPDDCDCDCTVL